MRAKAIGLAMLASAIIAAGCGSSTESGSTDSDLVPKAIADVDVQTGPFDSDDAFVTAVSDYCKAADGVFARYPVYGVSANGLAAEFTTRVGLETDDVANTKSIEAPADLADKWAEFNAANQALLDADTAILEAAKAGDEKKAEALVYGDATSATDDLSKLSGELGVDCFQEDVPLSDADPGAATDAAADAPQPSNSIDDAADEYLAAAKSGDCKQIVTAPHTQNYPTVDAIADPSTGDCSTYASNSKSTEVAGTAQFGPVGMAAYKYAPGQYSYEEFVLDPDKGDRLEHTATIYADQVGLDPAPDGNDADQQVQAFVDAIRANDPKALNATATVESPSPGESGFPQDGAGKVVEQNLELSIRAARLSWVAAQSRSNRIRTTALRESEAVGQSTRRRGRPIAFEWPRRVLPLSAAPRRLRGQLDLDRHGLTVTKHRQVGARSNSTKWS